MRHGGCDEPAAEGVLGAQSEVTRIKREIACMVQEPVWFTNLIDFARQNVYESSEETPASSVQSTTFIDIKRSAIYRRMEQAALDATQQKN